MIKNWNGNKTVKGHAIWCSVDIINMFALDLKQNNQFEVTWISYIKRRNLYPCQR